jgi:hypothetical protein
MAPNSPRYVISKPSSEMWPRGGGFFLQREQILNMDGMVKTQGTDGPPRALFRLIVTLKPAACPEKYSIDAKV